MAGKTVKKQEITMKTKQRALLGFIVLVAIFNMAGCATQKPVFDKGITKEEGATVLFNAGINVLTVNGIEIKKGAWNKGGIVNLVMSTEMVQVVLPAGKVDIVFDLYYKVSSSVTFQKWSAKNISLTLNLESGKQYTVAFVLINKKGVTKSGFGTTAMSEKFGIGVYNKLARFVKHENLIELHPIDFNLKFR